MNVPERRSRVCDRPLSRRRLLGASAAGGFAVASGAIARPGFIAAMVAQRQAPAFFQAAEVSGGLRVLFWGDGASDDPFNNTFRETFPGVELEIVGVPGGSWAEFADAVATRIAGGEKYDVVSIATEGQRVFAYRGLVEPFDDLIERDAAELEEYYADIDPRLVEWCRTLSSPDGQTYYLPGNFNTVGVWCNVEMFEAAGLAEPDGTWTWDEFKQAGLALSKEDESFGVEITQGQFPGVMPWLLTNGAAVLTPDWSEPVIDSPEAIAAAEFMRSLVAGKISPEPGGEYDAPSMMAQNRLGMMFAGKWPTPGIKELGVLDKIKIVDSPQMAGKGTPIGWSSCAILKGTENREAAWQYARFVSDAKVAPFVLFETPARRSAATSPEYIADNARGVELFYNAVDYATPVVGVEQASLIQQDLEDTFAQILVGNLPAAEALGDLSTKIQGNLV